MHILFNLFNKIDINIFLNLFTTNIFLTYYLSHIFVTFVRFNLMNKR